MIYVIIISIALFPLVLAAHFNKRIREFWYAREFIFSETLFTRDPQLKNNITKTLTKMADQKKATSGSDVVRVLEVGPGTGSNFPYYPPGVRLTTIEMNGVLEQKAAQNVSQSPDLVIEERISGNVEDMHMIRDEQFDAVVATYVLCCFRDPARALREIHRVLTPVSCIRLYTSCLHPIV